MNVVGATHAFERWLASEVSVVRSDLTLKHRAMAESPFAFFRATFYLWLLRWAEAAGDLAAAPALLGVGDLHVENYGTWRDREGRLIWGVNDFDEAWPAAYTLDVVRLATSAYLAIWDGHLGLGRKEAADAIEQGYRDALRAGGRPFILAEDHHWLRLLALSKLRDPTRFWARMRRHPAFTGAPPVQARRLLERSLPGRRPTYRLKRRVAGLGSLGQPRILALSSWHGAFIAREVKATRTAAWACWDRRLARRCYGPQVIARAVRVEDPETRFHDRWLLRRLAPDCSRIELASLPAKRDEGRLLYCMGWEMANVHLGSRVADRVRRDLERRRGRWLHRTTKTMLGVCLQDWAEWQRAWKKGAARVRGAGGSARV